MASEHDKYAGQVFVWAGSGNPKDVGEVVAKMRDRITALEEAVNVLADECYAWRTHTDENYYTNALRSAKNTDNNPIAAEAVRKAGG